MVLLISINIFPLEAVLVSAKSTVTWCPWMNIFDFSREMPALLVFGRYEVATR